MIDKIEKPYPLYQLIQDEIPDKRGSYNTIYTIVVKLNEDVANWYRLYDTFSKPVAELALDRLKELFDIHILKWLKSDENMPTMFEVYNQVYKTKYVFPDQSCICGDDIVGNKRYGEFSVYGVKYDYIQSTIFFYYEGDCVLKSNQLFLDGELLLNSQQLVDVCNEIGQDTGLLDSSPDKLLKYIANNYTNAKTYICEGYTCFDISKYK